MRLPAFTRRHQQQEDARLIHERLWEQHLEQRRVFIPAPPECTAHRLQARYSGNLRKFWNERGYLFRTETDKQFNGLWVWLEPMPSTLHLGKPRRPEAA